MIDMIPSSSQEGGSLVAIGGGGGTSLVLQGAEPYFASRTAVVNVTDTGRSTGIARAIVQMPAPGDVRNTIATLASDSQSLLARLVQYRFVSQDEPLFDGMAFGNLMLAALTQMMGDFAAAVEILAEMVGTTVRVLPVSTANVDLCAELEDGSMVQTELAVRGLNKAPIHHLFLSDTGATAYPPVIEAIEQATVVVLGPGSFQTSVLANLLFSGMAPALQRTPALVVFVCNTTTQPGQTDSYRTYDHIARLFDVVGEGVVDVVLINRSDNLDPTILAQYAAEGIYLLKPYNDEIERIATLGVVPLVRDYVETTSSGKRDLWKKQDTIRHNPALLGQTLWEVAQTYGKSTGRRD